MEDLDTTACQALNCHQRHAVVTFCQRRNKFRWLLGSGWNQRKKSSEEINNESQQSEQTVEQESKKKTLRGPRKNAPCPCGSGSKYKKCCWAKERHEARLTKMKDGTEETTEEDYPKKEEVFEMNGNFRVLQIWTRLFLSIKFSSVPRFVSQEDCIRRKAKLTCWTPSQRIYSFLIHIGSSKSYNLCHTKNFYFATLMCKTQELRVPPLSNRCWD